MNASAQSPFARPPDQVAFAYDDVITGVHEVGSRLGIDSWVGWNYTPDRVTHGSYRGQPLVADMRAAVPSFGPSVEVIDTGGAPSVYTEFLAENRQGMHHMGYFVSSIADARTWLARVGVEEVMNGGGHGLDGDGEFAYFDTRATMGCYLEVIEAPRRRRPPDFRIDAATSTISVYVVATSLSNET